MRAGVLAVAVVAALSAVSPASASIYDPIGSGQTSLTFSTQFLALLGRHGVELSARAPAKLTGATVTFPASGGRLDPVAVAGSIEHGGELLFKAGARQLPLKSLLLKTTQRHSPLAAKFGGGKLKLADSSRLRTERAGFGLAATVSQIRLSAKVATRLDKKLGLGAVFMRGQLLGAAKTIAQPGTVAIQAAGRASLELAPGFAEKLRSLFVAATPIFPAEHPGAFTLPIVGGKVAPDGSSGILQSAGALELLQIGGGQVLIQELWPELGGARTVSSELELNPSPPYAGRLGRVGILDLSPGTVAADSQALTIAVDGSALALQAATAVDLNEAFAKPLGRSEVFLAGEEFARISFVAQAE